MNKHNESRPFLDKLEAEIASGLPVTKVYQMVLEYLDERDQERKELAARVERLRGALGLCAEAAENTHYGWDGDCGVINKINCIVDSVIDETPAQSLEAVKREWEQELVKESEKRQREIISTMIDVERISKDPSAPIVDRLLAIGYWREIGDQIVKKSMQEKKMKGFVKIPTKTIKEAIDDHDRRLSESIAALEKFKRKMKSIRVFTCFIFPTNKWDRDFSGLFASSDIIEECPESAYYFNSRDGLDWSRLYCLSRCNDEFVNVGDDLAGIIAKYIDEKNYDL